MASTGYTPFTEAYRPPTDGAEDNVGAEDNGGSVGMGCMGLAVCIVTEGGCDWSAGSDVGFSECEDTLAKNVEKGCRGLAAGPVTEGVRD